MKPLEDTKLAAELRQLLVAVALGDATDVQTGRLNDLLLRDERLRHHAARFFEEETVLRREFELLDRVAEFHTPLAKDAGGECTPPGMARARFRTDFRSCTQQRLYLAVAVLIAATIGIVWLEKSVGTSSINHAVDKAHLRILPLAANILTPVTHVSWSGPQFASEVNARALPSEMHEGVISFTSAFGRPAQGYMVCLRPGALLDLVVAGDAEGENALAVIEFDVGGRPTGRRISFSNSAGERTSGPSVVGKSSAMTKKGRLGVWAEHNDSATPRYYLFTGVHKLLNRSADDSWHVSKLSAFVEEPGLLHIGWDDSGMPPAGDKDLSQIPDNDFDDVTATIRIRRSDSDSTRRAAGLHLYSKTAAYDDEPKRLLSNERDRYPFSVEPGQVAIVKVCSRSGAPVELAMFEKDSGKLQWRCRKGRSPSPTLGICAIENNTAQPRKFYLVGQKKRPAANAQPSLRSLSHSVLFEQEQFVTVSFDDDQLVSDFDKVRVDILTVDAI